MDASLANGGLDNVQKRAHATDVPLYGLQALLAATAATTSSSAASRADESGPRKRLKTSTAAAVAEPSMAARHRGKRLTRIRKACDLCRARKVKCDEAPPCQACRDLGVACTFQYVSRRRGPMSKYGPATWTEGAETTEERSAWSPTAVTPMPAAAVTLTPTPAAAVDDIAPLAVLSLLVDDYFTYLHPLMPFPHEPTFRQRFASAKARQQPGFVALLAGMVGVLAASFPRSVRAVLDGREGNDRQEQQRFPRAICMVDCCRSVALAARGAAFYSTPRLTVDDAATSYFLALAAGYMFQWHLCRRFFAEAMSFVQELGVHRRTAEGAAAAAAAAAAAGLELEPASPVDEQMGRRLFWVLFLAARSMLQLGTSASDVPLPPFARAVHFPELPAEVDDACITAEGIRPQPVGRLSLITGFNRAVAVYATMDRLAALEMASGLAAVPWAEQKVVLLAGLRAVKTVPATLPSELYLPLGEDAVAASPDTAWTSETLGLSPDGYDDLLGYQYYPPGDYPPESEEENEGSGSGSGSGSGEGDIRALLDAQPQRRRHVQFDIQKTNIYVSQLATRSYYVERYLHQRAMDGSDESGEDSDDAFVAAERARIVQSLLEVLAAIPQCNMEPNGSALINKVRQVASTLVRDDGGGGGQDNDKEAQLGRFLDILLRLEKLGGPDGDPDDELASWASLREEQMRFAARGGFLAN